MQIQRQAEQYPDATDFNRLADNVHEYPYQGHGHSPNDNLGEGEFLQNRDPELGTTVPEFHGGDPKGAVSDARIMHPEETGLEYPVLARPSGHGPKAFDIIKPLD